MEAPGAILDVVFDMGRADDLDEFRAVATAAVRRVVDGDLGSYTEVDLRQGHVYALVDPPIDASASATALAGLTAQHPLITRSCGRAETISDYLSARRYHSLELYHDVYRPLGAEDQLAISLQWRDEAVIGMALNRPRRSFTPSDRERLDLLRGPLVRGFHHALARERGRDLLDRLEQGRAGPELGVVALDRDGSPALISEKARRLLDAYFGCPQSGGLPTQMARWLKSGRRDVPDELKIPGQRGNLIVTVLTGRESECCLLELREIRRPSQSGALTPREREILHLVAAGEANANIASHLGVSRRTVENHLRSAFRKLGVSNRTAAAVALRAPPDEDLT
jgi:DNA-binding CsgD family transcriptional regulator